MLMLRSGSARRSLGGHAVEDSLRAAGFAEPVVDVALVETARVRIRPYSVVLAQNAWNVLSGRDFRHMMHPYPRRMRLRMRLRRLVALVNLRRARRVVCLTDYMADLCRARGCSNVEVSHCTVPDDALRYRVQGGLEHGDFVLVPGSVTWYKQSSLALDVASRLLPPGARHVFYAGPDDGSGCLEDLEEQAQHRGITVEQRPVPHEHLLALVTQARVVVLPSSLESLGFGLAEALLLGRRVLATPIPAHIEVAERMGRAPEWMPAQAADADPAPGDLSPVDRPRLHEEWVALGSTLGLTRSVGPSRMAP